MNNKKSKAITHHTEKTALSVFYVVMFAFSSLFLQSCGKKRLASVEERQTNNSNVILNTDDDYSAVDAKLSSYRVQAGDTLYSIAFRFGLDYRTLAKANGIGSNYLISIGQQLNIDAARSYQEPSNTQVTAVQPRRVATNNTRTSSKPKPAETVKPKPVPQKPTSQKPVTNSKPKPSRIKPKPVTTTNGRQIDSNNPVKFWIWPNMGTISNGFVATGKKGIDISGNLGDPVRASAAGRVVYAGRGLRGYGNLVIIKHNNSFISAYAHNRSILVKENEIIKAGQKIAEMGNSDSDVPKLHFEIRYKGKPTDPLKYLPKR